MDKPATQVEKSRNDKFAEKISTRIWKEEVSTDNPYIASKSFVHGYELLELMHHRSYVEVLYLLFRGELPGKEQASLLESLMIALCSPGPRHPATRAVIEAAVSKTDVSHLLPIGLGVLSGEHLGATEVELSMRFLRKNLRNSPQKVFEQCLPGIRDKNDSPLPGFGARFNGIDRQANQLAARLREHPAAGGAISWGCELVEQIKPQEMGWYPTGVAAATLVDLGFKPRSGAGIYQLLSAPGLLAHGVEMSAKSIHDIPFVSEDDFHTVSENE
jgi:citrate synthase